MEKSNKHIYYTACNNQQLSIIKSHTRQLGHALVLDQFAFWSINTKLTYPGDNRPQGWFCITYEDIALKTNYSVRTIKTLIKEFVGKDLIEKSVKKFYNDTRAWLRLSNKARKLLGFSPYEHDELVSEQAGQSFNPTLAVGNRKENSLNDSEREFFEHNCTSKSAETAPAYIKKIEKEKNINTITPLQGCGKNEKRYNVPHSVNEIFKRVGERLTESQKTTIWGAVFNLQHKHNKKISNLAEFVAWICFSILNAKHQLKTAMTFHHQLNCLMKIARTKKGLKKPRGFHNHWDIGKSLKSKQEEKEQAHKSAVHSRVEEPGSFVVAKKAKELWTDDGKLKELKAEKARLMMIGAGIESEKRAVKTLFANDKGKIEQELGKFEVKKVELFQQVEALKLKIRKIEESKEHALAQTWETLYA